MCAHFILFVDLFVEGHQTDSYHFAVVNSAAINRDCQRCLFTCFLGFAFVFVLRLGVALG